MFEQTNQTEVIEENLFDDSSSEQTNEEFDFSDENAGENESADAGEGETNQNGESDENEPERYEVVYNGQKLSLTLDELKTNAQKGMNYDHVHNELVNLRNSPALGVIERYARNSGMTTEQYVQYLHDLEGKQRVNQMTEQGVPEAYAKRLLELEDKDRARQEREAAEQKRADERAQYNKFIQEYPGVKAEDIPSEVWQRFGNGMDLTAAYAIYENKALKNQLQQYKQNEVNKQKSVGSVKGDSSETNSDAFLEGLLG